MWLVDATRAMGVRYTDKVFLPTPKASNNLYFWLIWFFFFPFRPDGGVYCNTHDGRSFLWIFGKYHGSFNVQIYL